MPILSPLNMPEDGLSAGCFIMAPFANRILGGRFNLAGQEIIFPMNRPEAGMACHGLARDLRWSIKEQRTDSVALNCLYAEDDYPWRFSMAMSVTLADEGISIGLELRNLGRELLPFGFGLHPYFPRRQQTSVTFSSTGAYSKDSWGLPCEPLVEPAGIVSGMPTELENCIGIDTCFLNWQPSVAYIDWPNENARMSLSAAGAFRHLHLFVPENRDVFCIEPVSHLPDAINRSFLDPSASMHVLSRDEALAATLQLQMSSIQQQGW